MKVVICGPAHSGKSVFLSGITKCLPRQSYYLFRACPDGEGSWTYRNEDSVKYRVKGSFTPEFVNWSCKVLAEVNLAPITLVDIGGKITPENKRILMEGKISHAVILSGDRSVFAEWRSFLNECGVSIVSEVYSDYDGTADDVNSVVPSVHHLERGEDVSSRPTIQKVACKLLELAKYKEEVKMVNEVSNVNGFINAEGVLSIGKLADTLGKTAVQRTLPNGNVVSQIVWEGADLIKISQLLHNFSGAYPRHIMIDGAAPAWLVSAITHELHPCSVSLNSPDGYIPVGCSKPSEVSGGNNLTFSVENREDGWVVVTAAAIDPSKPFSPNDLQGWTPPSLPMGSKVILSGRLPNWGMASIMMSYHGVTKAVALFQPGTGATVAMTHSAEVSLGEVIHM